MIAQADGLPIFLGNLAAAIRVVVDDIGVDNFCPGDLYLINDPYATGTHLNDLTTVNPVFDDDGELIAFTSARAPTTASPTRSCASSPVAAFTKKV